MTDTSIADVLTELDAIGEQSAQRQAEADKHRAAAQSAQQKAEQLAAQAAESDRLTRNEALHKLRVVMSEYGAQVSQARQQAFAAVHRGEGVVDAWVTYRLTAAAVRGRWQVLAPQYQAIVGRDAPPGPSAPELRAEPFEVFLRNAMPQAEGQAYQQALDQATAEANAHRDSKAKS